MNGYAAGSMTVEEFVIVEDGFDRCRPTLVIEARRAVRIAELEK